MDLDIKKTVKKSNLLNEVRNSNASLVEYRLFCVYLAHMKLNSEDNVVKFRLADYAKICGLDRPRRTDLESQANNIVAVTAQVDRPDGGFSVYNLFSEFRLFRENEEWMVSLECNSKIAPMIREQKGKFLRYKLYNTIYLKSYNQQRIYELLKQYQLIGVRLFDLKDLREYLSIKENEYPKWAIFARDVLKVAQKALKENTDICFDYEPIKKGKKVVQVRFTIYENHSFIDQLQIDDFIPATIDDTALDDAAGLTVRAADPDQVSIFDSVPELEDDDSEDFEPAPEDPIQLSLDALPEEFTRNQVLQLRELALQHIPLETPLNQKEEWLYHFFKKKTMKMHADNVAYGARFAWMKKVVENNWD